MGLLFDILCNVSSKSWGITLFDSLLLGLMDKVGQSVPSKTDIIAFILINDLKLVYI